MPPVIHPTPSYRAAFRKDDRGWDVAALQLNIGLPDEGVDGIFGDDTDRAVRELQRSLGLVVDGIAGPATQRAMCLRAAQAQEKHYNLPIGLMGGLIENESGFLVACYTAHHEDGGADLGACQRNVPAGASQDQILFALDLDRMTKWSAMRISTQTNTFACYGKVGIVKAIRYAVLNHNWPAAADRLARGLSIYKDPARDNQPQVWIEEASGGRLHTAAEWCSSYITRATKYVRAWPA